MNHRLVSEPEHLDRRGGSSLAQLHHKVLPKKDYAAQQLSKGLGRFFKRKARRVFGSRGSLCYRQLKELENDLTSPAKHARK